MQDNYRVVMWEVCIDTTSPRGVGLKLSALHTIVVKRLATACASSPFAFEAEQKRRRDKRNAISDSVAQTIKSLCSIIYICIKERPSPKCKIKKNVRLECIGIIDRFLDAASILPATLRNDTCFCISRGQCRLWHSLHCHFQD